MLRAAYDLSWNMTMKPKHAPTYGADDATGTKRTSPVARLRMRLDRLDGLSLNAMARKHGVVIRSVQNVTGWLPKAPVGQELETAMEMLRRATLAELGASFADVDLWRGLLAAAGGSTHQDFIVPHFDLAAGVPARQVARR
jgi:hypothetical protein